MASFSQQSMNSNEIPLTPIPTDGISSIAMNGTIGSATNMVCAGSWDNSLNCYELVINGSMVTSAQLVGQIKHEAPVLCCDIGTDQYTTFSGGADGHVYMWNATQAATTATKIGRHDNPIRCLKWMPEISCVATGSWDKTIKIWDTRQPTPAMTIPFEERVYAMDIKNKLCVVGTADLDMHVFQDITMPQNKYKYKSPLQYQTRCVSIFADGNTPNGHGYAVGSIEGRVAIEYFEEVPAKVHPNPKAPQNAKCFVFKCHRDGNDIYGVNCIDFHTTNKFLTAGTDGVVVWWDKDARNRLCSKEKYKKSTAGRPATPISAAKFTPNGAGMVYAASYDWSMGHSGAHSQSRIEISYMPVNPADIATKRGK